MNCASEILLFSDLPLSAVLGAAKPTGYRPFVKSARENNLYTSHYTSKGRKPFSEEMNNLST
jgi:hypothetical protein